MSIVKKSETKPSFTSNLEDIKDKINHKYLTFLNDDKRVFLIAGGRNTGKSFFGATICLIKIFNGESNCYAFRKSYKDAERDTANLILQVGRMLFGSEAFEDHFQYHSSYSRITCKHNGMKIYCRGVGRYPENLKSFGDISFVWVDEATNFSEEEIKTLLPSIEERADNSQLLLTSNIPPSQKHFLYRLFLKNKDHHYKILLTSYKDNPFVDQDKVLKSLKAIFPKGSNGYMREILGEVPETSETLLIRDFEKMKIERKFEQIYILVSFQHGNFFAIAIAKEQNLIFILEEYYLDQLKKLDTLIEKIIEDSQKYLFVPSKKTLNFFFDSKEIQGFSFLIESMFQDREAFAFKNKFKLEDLKIFNFYNITLILNDHILKTEFELSLAEWQQTPDQEEKIDKLINKEKLKFLSCLCLSKPLLADF